MPAWTSADFDCGAEPTPPPEQTTKSAVESYQVDTTAWGRTCQVKLMARGADAARYGLVGGDKKQ